MAVASTLAAGMAGTAVAGTSEIAAVAANADHAAHAANPALHLELVRNTGPHDSLGIVAREALPVEARATHQLILSGGPFPHSKDGTVFGNRERILPARPRGQYREYTVRTPGAQNRGARRIVCGGLPPTKPDVCYYTADHYASFRRIAQ